MKYDSFLGKVAAYFVHNDSKRRNGSKFGGERMRDFAPRKARLEVLESRELLAADVLSYVDFGASNVSETANLADETQPVEFTLPLATEASSATVDLTFYKPDGWSDSTVLSTSSTATTSQSEFFTNQHVWLRFAYKTTEPVSETITQQVFLDGTLVKAYKVDGSTIPADGKLNVSYDAGKLGAGKHTISIKLDGENAVAESDESNNERSITFTVSKSLDDAYEPNDTFESASDLGKITTTKTFNNLVAGKSSNKDWYKFTLTGKGDANSSVELNYTHSANVDVNLYLYDASGTQLAKSTGTSGVEKISLNGRAAGTYYVCAYNADNVAEYPSYSLTITPPVATDLAFSKPTAWSDSVILSSSSTGTTGQTEFSTEQEVFLKFAYNTTTPITGTVVQQVRLNGKVVKSYEVDGKTIPVDDRLECSYSFGALSAGNYTVSVTLDATNVVTESDETNNLRTIRFAVSEPKDDAYEPNDAFKDASDLETITTTKTLTDLIAGMSSNEDWYKFTLENAGDANSSVELSYAHTNKADVNLYLYDANGKKLAESVKTTGNEKISLNGYAAGTYYVLARNDKSVMLNAPYSLTITPPTSTPTPTADLTFSKPDAWSDSVILTSSSTGTTGQTDFSTKQYVRAKFAYNTTESIKGTVVQQVYLDGKLVKSYNVDGTTIPVDGWLEVESIVGKLSEGEHTITVKLDGTNVVKESNEENNERTITFNVYEPRDDDYEPNDTRATAYDLGTITTTKTLTDLIAGMSANKDWYKFTLENDGDANSSVELNYEHIKDKVDVNLFLYNAAGKQIAKSTKATGKETISLDGVKAGTYYVYAYNYKKVLIDAPYSLTITPPTSTPTADLTFSKPDAWSDSVILTSSSTGTTGQTDFSTNQYVCLRFAYNTTEPVAGTVVQQVLLDGKLVKSYNVDGATIPVDGRLEVYYNAGKLQEGKHTITIKLDGTNVVAETDEENNERTITFNVYEPNDDDYEPNDSRAKATDLGTITTTKTLNDLIAGMSSNKDWYKFTLANDGDASSSVELDYEHIKNKVDVNLYLYNASGTQIAKSTKATGKETISLDGVKAGTYYVYAYNYKKVSIDAPYSLTITPPDSDDAYEPNDSFEAATDLGTIEKPQTITDLIAGASSNQDWYKFTLANPGASDSYVKLFYDHNENANVDLFLYDAEGTKLRSSTKTTGTETISLNNLEAGTYYVKAYNVNNVAVVVDYELSICPPATADLTFYQPTDWSDSVIAVKNPNEKLGETTVSTTDNVFIRFAFKSNEAVDETFVQNVYMDGKFVGSVTVDGSEEDVVGGLYKTVDLGTDLPIGKHTITVKLDASNAVREKVGCEENNERSITLMVQKATDDKYEPNDTIETAADLGTITTTQTYNLVAGRFSNVDWYKFTLEEDGDVNSSITLTSLYQASMSDVNLWLYDATGKQIAQSVSKTGKETISLNGRSAGTYYIRAFNIKSAALDVDYTMTITPPATVDESQAIAKSSVASASSETDLIRSAFEDDLFTQFEEDDLSFLEGLN